MDEYQYSLFFEARHLTADEEKKVTRYFQKRRDSGGGECGKIEKVRDNIYKVSFKEQQDQDRVLKKKIHTVVLPDGELQLSVNQSSSPQTQDQPSTSRSQTYTKTNTKNLEKIFRLDVFLMYFLRDNPKVFKVLKKQLSEIDCTVELDFEEEEAVVRGKVEKIAGGASGSAAERWELQLDKIFISFTEGYICYHIVDPEQVKKVLQDRLFVTEDLKVYSERGYVVVVGETDVVKEKIASLEKSVPTQKQLQVVAERFKLIDDEFAREMSSNYPDVKVIKGTNIVILEGPEDKVQSGAAKLDELIMKIKERKVQLHPDLLTFMRTSGAASKYQTRFRQSLRSPVSLEVGSDLVLSSLSPDALYEAETAVLRDLSVASVQLHGAEARPPNLNKMKDTLVQAKNEANRGEIRVDVGFITSTGTQAINVQLVGYIEYVNKLKEVLQDYQENQISTQEVLNLQLPEMVNNFDKLLKMIDMKQTNVTMKPSYLPNPCVILSGPKCHVKETQQALVFALSSMVLDTLVLDGPGALSYFQGDGKVNKELVEGSCQVLILEQQGIYSPTRTTKPQSIRSFTSRPSIRRSRVSTGGDSSINNINLEIRIGSLEEDQANVLVAPVFQKQLTSTNIGKSLLQKGGNTFQSNFNSKAGSCTLHPGEVLQVDASSSLGCSKVFCIECLPWDGVTGKSVQALSNGLRRCLDLCVQQNFSSVAIPIIGPGPVFKYSLSEAIQVLMKTIHQFGLSASSGTLTTIYIVIKPGYPDSEACYHEAYKRLSSNMNQGGKAVFRSLTTDLDDVVMTVGGGAQLQLVFGDITNETTDVVVNTTDFKNFHNEGVCKDILTVAGSAVEAQLKTAKVNRGQIFTTQPGSFPCKAILHVCGEKDPGVVEDLVVSIIEHCENSGFTSVAIPAICAGAGGLDPGVVAGAILRGIQAVILSTPLYSLTTIRLVLIKINVFLAFKEEATQTFTTSVRRVSAPQWSPVQQQPSVPVDLSVLSFSSANQQSTFLFLGLCQNDVDDAKKKLKDLYKTQCSNRIFQKEELESLTEEDLLNLQQLVENEGLCMKNDQSGNLTVNGLKDGVNKVTKVINESLHKNLKEEMRIRDEDNLYTRVVWCILGENGNWERFPKTANYYLENKDLTRGIQDAKGVSWQVDLVNMEARTRSTPARRTKIKRLENLPDFTFPLYWDSMDSEMLDIVELQQSSREYQIVKEAFKRTVKQTVMKIQRLQNIHLRRAYEAKKKHLSEKNKHQGGEGEKLLYHGTTEENSGSIMETGFNRSFAGQNATSYGDGTYFAVRASYSAHPTYSRPAADGSQLMFVVRVLTGIYTLGQSGMKVPPPVDDQQPNNRYDSLVDRIDNPNMYVVFHDDQAYPDYLITFK